MSEMLTLEGFHGTSEENAKSIERNNFQPSEGGWLGSGIYFYLGGISNPQEDAKNWAISEAYRPSKRFYDRFCVLKARIQIGSEAILDLRTEEDLRIFHTVTRALKEEVVARCYNEGSKIDIGDETLCIEAAKHLELQGFIGWFYSLVDPKERSLRRKGKERFKIPNVTVLCVLDVATIDKNSITLLECDEVPYV